MELVITVNSLVYCIYIIIYIRQSFRFCGCKGIKNVKNVAETLFHFSEKMVHGLIFGSVWAKFKQKLRKV